MFVVHLSCWLFIISNPEPFKPLLSLRDKSANINLQRAIDDGCIPLSQLFTVQPKTCDCCPNFDTKTINLRYLIDHHINWKIVDDFIPGVTKLSIGTIYLPRIEEIPVGIYACVF